MKNLTKVLFVIIFLSLVFSLYSGLYADAKKCKEVGLKCAVCGTDISKDTVKIKTEYKGKTYYFASEKCKAEFEKNLEKYVKTCVHKAFYASPGKECDYKSDKPGKCPTCGMNLKKVTTCPYAYMHEHEHNQQHMH